jgi:hypothetical protein
MKYEKPPAQKTIEAVDKMIDPNTFPPPPPDHYEVVFKHWPGDKVNVEGLFEGIVTACAVNNTGGNVVLIDNGYDARWYPEIVVRPVHYHPQPYPPGPLYRGEDQKEG